MSIVDRVESYVDGAPNTVEEATAEQTEMAQQIEDEVRRAVVDEMRAKAMPDGTKATSEVSGKYIHVTVPFQNGGQAEVEIAVDNVTGDVAGVSLAYVDIKGLNKRADDYMGRGGGSSYFEPGDRHPFQGRNLIDALRQIGQDAEEAAMGESNNPNSSMLEAADPQTVKKLSGSFHREFLGFVSKHADFQPGSSELDVRDNRIRIIVPLLSGGVFEVTFVADDVIENGNGLSLRWVDVDVEGTGQDIGSFAFGEPEYRFVDGAGFTGDKRVLQDVIDSAQSNPVESNMHEASDIQVNQVKGDIDSAKLAQHISKLRRDGHTFDRVEVKAGNRTEEGVWVRSVRPNRLDLAVGGLIYQFEGKSPEEAARKWAKEYNVMSSNQLDTDRLREKLDEQKRRISTEARSTDIKDIDGHTLGGRWDYGHQNDLGFDPTGQMAAWDKVDTYRNTEYGTIDLYKTRDHGHVAVNYVGQDPYAVPLDKVMERAQNTLRDLLREDEETEEAIQELADTDYKDPDAHFKMVQLLKGVAGASQDGDDMAKKYLDKLSDLLATIGPDDLDEQHIVKEAINDRAVKGTLVNRLDNTEIMLDRVENIQSEITSSGPHPAMAYLQFRVVTQFNADVLKAEKSLQGEFREADNVVVQGEQPDQLKVRLESYLLKS